MCYNWARVTVQNNLMQVHTQENEAHIQQAWLW